MKQAVRSLFTASLAAFAAMGLGTAPAAAAVDVNVEVQAHLTALGFQPGGIDGAFGRGSRTALAQFERQAGLPADGRIDPQVRAELLRRVEAQQVQRFGSKLTGFWGTAQRCKGNDNRIRVLGYTVSHQPIWSSTSFDYVMMPGEQATQLSIVWDRSNRQRGRSVVVDRARGNVPAALRVPELNMFPVQNCSFHGVNETVGIPVPKPVQPGSTPSSGGNANDNENQRVSDLTNTELYQLLWARISEDRKRFEAIRQERDNLKDNVRQKDQRIRAFADRSNAQVRENQRLQGELNQAQERIAALTQRIETLRDNRAGPRARRLAEELAETKGALNFANQQIQQLQRANQALSAQLQGQGRPTQTIQGQDALQIIIPQLLEGLTGN